MRLMLMTVNHHAADIATRERLALDADQLDALTNAIVDQHEHAEAMVLSTCNRTEVYVAKRGRHGPPSDADLVKHLADACGTTAEDVAGVASILEGDEAINHLFRLTSGLESMLVGEPQILGQVRRAYEHASMLDAVGPTLHAVLQRSIAVARQVRNATGIGDGRVSVGSVAVDLARQIFATFDDKVVVCIGAGEVAKLLVTHLADLNPRKLYLTNRTRSRAERLQAQLPAKIDAETRDFEALDDLLVEADIVITSTGARQPIITVDRLRSLRKRRRSRPLFLVDVAMPRDVEPAAGDLNNVYAYNIDDLQHAISETMAYRGDQVNDAHTMISQHARDCFTQLQHQDVGRLIHALRNRLHDIGVQESSRTLRKAAAMGIDEQALESLMNEFSHRVVNKILHMPLNRLKERDHDTPLGFYAAALRRLFELDDQEDELAARNDTQATPCAPDLAAKAAKAADEADATGAGTGGAIGEGVDTKVDPTGAANADADGEGADVINDDSIEGDAGADVDADVVADTDEVGSTAKRGRPSSLRPGAGAGRP